MAGKKTTTVTNVLRTNATDTKKMLRLMGQPVAEGDKLHVLHYRPYAIDNDGFLIDIGELYTRFALVPDMVTVEQAATAYTAADGRELGLLQRLIDAGIASAEDQERFNLLRAKADGNTTQATYFADVISGHTVYDTDDFGKLLTTLTLS